MRATSGVTSASSRSSIRQPPGSRGRARSRPRRRSRSAAARSCGREELGARQVLGIDRQALDEPLPRRLGALAQLAQRRPGRLGVDEVDRHRRDAAPVVRCRRAAAARAASGARFGGACTFDLAARARGARARPSPRPRRSVSDDAQRIGVPGFGWKGWTIASWMWPWRSCELADREQRVDALRARLADAEQDARS